MISKIRFVDRIPEIKNLEEFSKYPRPEPLYIYGPEGCGKTRLLKEYVKIFKGIGIYIDALEESNIERSLLISPSLEKLESIITTFIETINRPIGKTLATLFIQLLNEISKKVRLKEENILIAIDDITRAIGLNKIDWYVKWLYETISKISEKYEPKTVTIIATTSEGISLRRIVKHRHAMIRLLWNLEFDHFKELSRELKREISEDFIYDLWNYTGGNPGRLIEIALQYRWKLKTWYEELKKRLETSRVITKIKVRKLISQLEETLKDPDTLYYNPTEKLLKLYDILEEQNLMINITPTLLSERKLEANLELGIGKHYAWQMPAYKKALEELIKIN